MQDFGKILIYIGILLVVVGLIWQIGGRFLSFGKLPGDIVIEKENFKFYFPLATCIILSAVLSLIMWLMSGNRQ